MTDEEFKRLKVEIDEVAALRDNMSATQNRCSELLNDNRRLKSILRRIQEWDCLNPPRVELCGDLNWLKGLVDGALKDD